MTLSYASVFNLDITAANGDASCLCSNDGLPSCVCGFSWNPETEKFRRKLTPDATPSLPLKNPRRWDRRPLRHNQLTANVNPYCGGGDDDEEGYRGSGRITANVNPGCNGGDCGHCWECVGKQG